MLRDEVASEEVLLRYPGVALVLVEMSRVLVVLKRSLFMEISDERSVLLLSVARQQRKTQENGD